jgi:hypothetical protein
MQDEPISGLSAANLPLTGTEVLVLVQDGITKKTGLDNLPEQLDSNELAAVQNANAPTEVNPFATIDDLPLSGTWTCTLGGPSNVTDLVVVGNSTYFRIGNLVQGTIRVQCLATDAVEGSFVFDLPVATTVFPNNNLMHCTIGMINPSTDIIQYYVKSVVSDQLGEVTVLAVGNVVVDAVITFNYLVA